MSTEYREINQLIKPFLIQGVRHSAKKPEKTVRACLGSSRCGKVLIKSKLIVGGNTRNHPDENHTSNRYREDTSLGELNRIKSHLPMQKVEKIFPNRSSRS